MSTTVFYKDIVSQVVPVSSKIPLTITQINGDGSTQKVAQSWTYSSYVNGPGIGVTGAEFSYQQNFDFLPKPFDGFGFLGNYTYLQSHGGTLPLIGASKNNYTASIYYEKGWFGGRVTYTYRGKFYSSTEGNTQDQVWEQPFGTLDANVTFGIGDHVSVGARGYQHSAGYQPAAVRADRPDFRLLRQRTAHPGRGARNLLTHAVPPGRRRPSAPAPTPGAAPPWRRLCVAQEG